MIDVLNKHFQNSLHVSKAQSALVQFSNYMGYFLMAIPSGMLARRFGYKGGNHHRPGAHRHWCLLVHSGHPNWHLRGFPGRSFHPGHWVDLPRNPLPTPYATALGPPELGAARINLAQSCNGIGWILGPLVGGHFVLSSTAEIKSQATANLYLPYLGVGLVVTVLLVIFLLSKVARG